MDIEIPPLEIKIMCASNPPKSRVLVQRLAVSGKGRVSGLVRDVFMFFVSFVFLRERHTGRSESSREMNS